MDPGLRRDDAKRKRPAEAGRTFASLAKPELRDQRQIAVAIRLAQVIEQRAALVDHHQQAAARMVVLRMALEMLGQVADALGQDRDLGLGGAGVAFLAGVLLDEFLAAVCGNRHRVSFDIFVTD